MLAEKLRLPLSPAGEATERPINIAIVAMGGQGGGVLTGWIVKLAENAGWTAQSTSVPGVAQRTGATIYYVEMMASLNGQKPILSQMPTPGDVDIVMASEFMEAGRSILRGIVTPDRTTLIASTHRSFTVTEKMAPGEGIADSPSVSEAVDVVARQQILFDMDALAVRHGSVISAAMFGALAGSGALPFAKADYHAVIEGEGKGVAASLKAFDAAFDEAGRKPEDRPAAIVAGAPSDGVDKLPTAPSDARLLPLFDRIVAMPAPVQPMAWHGLRKVIDYQDLAYGEEYLALLEDLVGLDMLLDGGRYDHAFAENGAKYLANAMTYDDVIRVADLKTRGSRRDRIAKDVGVRDGQILHTTEFMHPRMEEVTGMLPAAFGRWLKQQDGLYAWLDRRVNKGRRVRTYSLRWFVALYILGGLKGLRRRSLRHAEEVAHRDAWLKKAGLHVRNNYLLGVEVLKCRRLIKGYSDTHARGLSKFDRVMETIDVIKHRADAADWARRLREAAIKDAEMGNLDGLIRTIRSF